MSEKIYFLEEVATKLNVESKRVKDWLKEGWLIGTKVVTEWHIKESDLINFLSQNPTIPLAGYSKGFADGIAKNAKFYYPEGVAVDLAGNIYVADTKNHRIRKITQTGVVTTIAGGDEKGFVDGVGQEARFHSPTGIVVDFEGYIYVVDSVNHAIRKISSVGEVITLAGSGKSGYIDGLSNKARFAAPYGIVVDKDCNVYISEQKNNRIRKIEPNGNVTTFAGNGKSGSSDGSRMEAEFSNPMGMSIDSIGNIYVVDKNTRLIRKIATDNQVTTIAGNSANHNWNYGKEVALAKETGLGVIRSIVIDKNNNIYLTDRNGIKKISADGQITIFSEYSHVAYRESLIESACFHEPTGLAIDSQGSLYVTEAGCRVRKILAPGIITSPSFINLEPTKIEISLKSEPKILNDLPLKDKPIKDLSEKSNQLMVSTLVTFKFSDKEVKTVLTDGLGRVYILAGQELYQVISDGELKFITNSQREYWQRENLFLDKQSNLYQAIGNKIYKLNLENIQTDKENPYGKLITTFPQYIRSITVDSLGNIYAASQSREIYKFTTNKEIVELPINKEVKINGDNLDYLLANVKSMVTDKEGNLYFTTKYQICKIDSEGILTAFVGSDSGYKDGRGQEAKFKSVYCLAMDADSNIYVTDTESHVIRKVTLTGEVTWFAGRRTKGFTDGTLKDAQFKIPFSLAIDNQGIFYVIDFANKCLRVIKKEDQELNLCETSHLKEPIFDNVVSIKAQSANKTQDSKLSIPTSNTAQTHPSSTQPTDQNIAKFIIPKAEDLFCVYIEERGSPCGLMERYDVINNVAEKANIEDVLKILENPQELGQLVTCLVVIGRMLIRNPMFSERAEKAFLNLMSDNRTYYAKVEQFDNQFVGNVGYMANSSYYELVKKKKDIDEQIKCIIDGIYSVIQSESKDIMTNYSLYAFYNIWQSLEAKKREEKAKEIGQVFCEIIADRSRLASQRIRAYESITWEIGVKRETKTIFEEIRLKAGDILLEVYIDSTENEDLHKYVKDNLNTICPNAIERLQMKGLIATKPVPDVIDLFSYSSVDESKINEFAREVNAYEVLELLQNHRTIATEKLFAAVYLAPILARRYNWQAFAYALTNLLFVYKEYSFKIGYSDVKLEISKNSSDGLAKLLKERASSDKEIVIDYLWKIISIVLDRGFSFGHYTDAFSWDFKHLVQELKIQDEYERFLLNIMSSTWRSPIARYLAYIETNEYQQKSQDVAWDILLNPNEDPNLRSLIGSRLGKMMREKITTLVDTTQKPWQLLPKTPKHLPISTPKDSVPESWLIATLTIARDYEVLRITMSNLAERLGIENKYTREEINDAREKVIILVEKYPDFLNILKKMCKKRIKGNIAIVAARMLALLGDPREEETMISLIADGIDGWTTLKPFSSEWSGLNLLMSVLASNKVTDNVYSCFDPYIIVGYGDEKARLMTSKVFVLLAERYEKEGDRERAFKAYNWAIKRDGFNLAARQGLKKLEEAK